MEVNNPNGMTEEDQNNISFEEESELEKKIAARLANREPKLLEALGELNKIIDKDLWPNMWKYISSNSVYSKIFNSLRERLEISLTEIVFLTILCDNALKGGVSLRDIGDRMGFSSIEMLQKKQILSLMMRRGLVAIKRGCYFVPGAVLSALERNERYVEKIKSCSTDKEFYEEMFRRMTQLSENYISKMMAFDVMGKMMDKNANLKIVKTLEAYKAAMSEEEFFFLVSLSIMWLVKGSEYVRYSDLTFMLHNNSVICNLRSSLLAGTSVLLTKGIIKIHDGTLRCTSGYELTAETKKKLCPDYTEDTTTDNTADPLKNLFGGFDQTEVSDIEEEIDSRLLPASKIQKRTLFYNEATERQVTELSMLLKKKEMKKMLRRLKSSSLRCGFACLFHGGPGTGKTETVLQLAKMSGRDVFQVDVSKLRSKWYGESERLVKGVFDDYRRIVENSKVAPIMLFNEADAIFNRRMENAERSVDKGENALQNIILQEMETLDGILIATTNLQGNLDPAFERRFLYKVEFGTPDVETRAKIWRSMMPTLGNGEEKALAELFPSFAGGQIENILRKVAINDVLHGGKTEWNDLVGMCNQEQIDSQPKRTIGFRPTTC